MRLIDFLPATIATLFAAAFTFFVLAPTNGFDDANITMNYAENIANGHGYVFYIGGERVEGSTSLLWTAINVLGYLLPIGIEVWLGALGVLITIATIFVTIQISREISDEGRWLGGLVASGFLFLPSFFGWTIWSYMDIGLWILLSVSFLLLTVRIMRAEPQAGTKVLYYTLGALLVATRPEGIAAACGIAIVALLFSKEQRSVFVLAIASSIVAFGIITLARLWYFDLPFPNTFYAKVSTSFFDQLWEGLKYVVGYLGEPYIVLLVFGFASFPLLAGADGVWLWCFSVVVVFGVFLIYAGLGGDHFGSYRFLQAVNPILIAFVAAAISRLFSNMSELRLTGLVAAAFPIVPFSTLLVGTWSAFYFDKGNYEIELRIAEHGYSVGETLNGYPGNPSIAVIAAGGVGLSYKGTIYDLLGLNWVQMAHANRVLSTDRPIGHAGFDRGVFFETLPDIVDPTHGECFEDAFANRPWEELLLDGLFQDPEFQALYEFECWNDLVFFRKM